ncbi:HD domain-containing protein [Microvirga zambiensis]|uniref:HD domain-containing protein n=1 Tax=Microvirga zambiensis TaxID=1402137 RepID=UPI00191DD035|nr:HD domain-containing protein [Microvirga zambiensis]
MSLQTDNTIGLNPERIAADIEAITRLSDSTLRAAVTRTWIAALEKGGYASFDGIPVSTGLRNRSLLQHVNDVNSLALYLLQLSQTSFGLDPDWDTTLAAAILHDVDKAFIQRRTDSGSVAYVDGYTMRDHGPAGAALAQAYGIPEAVCELVRNHAPFNYDGHLPPTIEGTIIHYADLTAFDLAANQSGAPPIHARSILLKKDHPLLRQVREIEAY